MPDSAFEEFLSTYPPEVRALAQLVREVILSAYSGVEEIVDPPSRIIAYGRGRKYSQLICAIQPQKAYVNLVFSRGVDLPDPAGLLEGTGKRARHVKIHSAEDAASPALRALVEAGQRFPGL